MGLLALVVSLTSNFANANGSSITFNDRLRVVYSELSQPLRASIDKELKCLADNIYHEARGEPFEGKIAVAQVTVNRSESGKFPNTICDVIKQRTKIVVMEENKPVTKIVCQFSWVCTGNRVGVASMNEAWQHAMEIARMVLLDGYRIPLLDDALFFHAVHVRPGWRLPKVARVGNHVFYSDAHRAIPLN